MLFYKLSAAFFYEYIKYGGYPAVVMQGNVEIKKALLGQLVFSYSKKDVLDYGIEKPEIYILLMRSLAYQTGDLLNITCLSNHLDVSQSTIERYLFVMQKALHIQMVRPFFNNRTKELKKMPKPYFFDTGIRNSLRGDFLEYHERADKGSVLENLAFQGFLTHIKRDDIQFWRTPAAQEVDFIVKRKKAFEIKQTPTKFDIRKYQGFVKQYPLIPLAPLGFYEIMKPHFDDSVLF